MDAFLGSGGILVPFKCPSDVGITSDRPSTYRTTLGGRVKAQRGPASRRQWSVDLSTATPAQVANLQALVEGGKPPWVWVEPYAQVTNLLSPEQSVLAPGTWAGAGVVQGGAVLTADGVYTPRTLQHATGGTMDFAYRAGSPDRPPVSPGLPVAWSLHLRGQGLLRLSFRDWAGQIISDRNTAYNNIALTKTTYTSVAPPGAAAVHLSATGALEAALPVLSWTVDAPAWSIGRGCNRVSSDGLSEAVQLAVRDAPDMRRSSISFTLTEVG